MASNAFRLSHRSKSRPIPPSSCTSIIVDVRHRNRAHSTRVAEVEVRVAAQKCHSLPECLRVIEKARCVALRLALRRDAAQLCRQSCVWWPIRTTRHAPWRKLSSDSSESLPTSNMVTACFLRLMDRLPIMMKAVSVESNRKPMRLPRGFPMASAAADDARSTSGSSTSSSVPVAVRARVEPSIRHVMCQSPPCVSEHALDGAHAHARNRLKSFLVGKAEPAVQRHGVLHGR